MCPSSGHVLSREIPVFEREPSNAAELAGVVRHQDEPGGKGDGGDEEIIGPNRRATGRQISADPAVALRRAILEGQRDKHPQERFLSGAHL